MELTVFSSCDTFPPRLSSPPSDSTIWSLQISARDSCRSRWIGNIGVSALESWCCNTNVKNLRLGWRGLPQNREEKKLWKYKIFPHSTRPSNSTSEHGLASRLKIWSSNWVVVYAALLIFYQHILFHVLEFGVRRWGIIYLGLLFLRLRTEARNILVDCCGGVVSFTRWQGLARHDGGAYGWLLIDG